MGRNENAENDVEYAELSMAHEMALQAPSGRVTSSHRAWDPSSEPLDEHVMLFHLFELQDRQTGTGTSQGVWNNKPSSSSYKSSQPKPEQKKPRSKTFMDTLDFNLGTTLGVSSTTTDEPNPLDIPSTSSAPILRTSQSSVHPKVVSACMRKVLSGKYRPRDDVHLPSRGSNSDSVNKWTEQTIPLPTNAQGDICPLEILFQSINFETTPESLDQVLKFPPVGTLRSPSPPRAVPVPVSEPSRDGSSAFSWTPSLLANRKLPKTQEDAGGSGEIRKKTTRSPDRPKSS